MKEIVFAGGCFWGVEEFFSRINGVTKTEVGYANGNIKNPTYELVCRIDTGFAEAVYILYDESKVKLDYLIDKYFSIIDPTSLNKQGNDKGKQYRTGIYYLDKDDLNLIDSKILEEAKKYNKKIVVEVEPLKNYYPAEEYHQKYLKKNPFGYCHIKLE
ncbi:peptide-methionine (S)-S-oxide reductase MsrA [Clostridium paraputrificum]|uniref:peptide-methionine (S)-S-oxide reductase MsrA n=1 Tax=Clostridium paraputrificum TaxID=29363 RepID=UPI00189EE15D|nr:peptide-methionine (S)-S-oxide reductase MsrA [Clostridium paraputrificum]